MRPFEQPPARTVFGHPAHFLAFGFGSGLSPVAPGTAGTLAAIPLYLLIAPLPLYAYALVTLVALVAGFWICGRSSALLGVHDHRGIVWDEIVGYFITMAAAPHGWAWVLAGFVLFRIFDVLKPWPANWADRQLHGGVGIVMDDVFAGIYALIVMQIAAHSGWL
ncbi:phosphatidylglycerophosphatase A family protein [Acidihalobacter prosperus]|uniref:Phosphatidylglycerophosphatase A n=1 Tax=Acidihalobacter prosperus TaxID=160660 RepID=A0A1A6C2E0_9GAMM|nr:phosphatidylglycerophosphatase A [Acidihalobacter prosperus]OBS08715.1 phosphatidylglycerophosphatase A [Acidihalobacter prosperus]